MTLRWLSLLVAVILSTSLGCADFAATYNPQNLGTLGGSTSSARAISNNGFVAGYSTTATENRNIVITFLGYKAMAEHLYILKEKIDLRHEKRSINRYFLGSGNAPRILGKLMGRRHKPQKGNFIKTNTEVKNNKTWLTTDFLKKSESSPKLRPLLSPSISGSGLR